MPALIGWAYWCVFFLHTDQKRKGLDKWLLQWDTISMQSQLECTHICCFPVKIGWSRTNLKLVVFILLRLALPWSSELLRQNVGASSFTVTVNCVSTVCTGRIYWVCGWPPSAPLHTLSHLVYSNQTFVCRLCLVKSPLAPPDWEQRYSEKTFSLTYEPL